MLNLPIAERELRVGARSNGTYSSRRNIALVVVLIFAALYWNLGTAGGWAAAKIFALLAAFCFAYSLFAGLILTADSISSEKRDGTLGLLFLTALKPIDLIAGTISATSLKAFYGLLAAFPILGVSFLLGGVEYVEFGRVCLTLISALIFSLSLSLLVSCLSRKRLFATSRAALGLIFFTVAIPIFCDAAKRALPAPIPAWINVLNLFSPTATLQLAGGRWVISTTDFWVSLLIVNAMSAAMLLASCLLLPWIWKDGAAGPRIKAWSFIAAKFTALRLPRKAVRNQNPFYWLASRQSWESSKFLIGLLVCAVAASVIGGFDIARGKNSAFENQLMAWSFLLAGAHAILFFKFAALATSRLAEDRELGALESILVTPLRVRRIIRGQWHAIVTQLGGPALAVLFLHGIIFWATLSDWSLDREISGGATGVLRMMWDELKHGSAEPWEIFCMSAIIIGSSIVIFLDWIAMGWVGMWLALRARRASWAIWLAIGAAVVPPTAAFAIVVTMGVWMDLARGNGPFWGWFCILFGFAFGVLNALWLIVYSFGRLRRNFRVVATQRFGKTAEHDYSSLLHWGIRIGAAAALIALCLLGFYGEEKWRGLRAWHKVQRRYMQSGRALTTHPMVPAAIPDAENFGAAKVFKPLFDYYYDSSGKVVWRNESAQIDVMTITVSGNRSGSGASRGDWTVQKRADFVEWQNYYRSNAVFARICATNEAPEETVLRALSEFNSELNELEEASRRPRARFPIHYEETHGAYWMHLPFLKNVSDVVALRASAKLTAGNIAGARGDIEFLLRMASALKTEPGVFPFRIRRTILNDALQPLWEGLASYRWDEDSLKRLQERFSIDVLSEYPEAIRGQIVNMADFLDRVTMPDEQMLARIGPFPISPRAARFYPSGWKYLNQAGAFRLLDETLLPVVDPAAHRVYVSHATNLVPAIRASHVALDPISYTVIPWEVQMFTDAALETAHTQVALDEAVIACAIERHRLKRGSLPSDLASFSPNILAPVPCDPMTGRSYIYQTIAKDRFILYSPGWNEQDDGGETSMTTRQGRPEPDLRKGDWVWKYPAP